jgi:hypothetical protein
MIYLFLKIHHYYYSLITIMTMMMVMMMMMCMMCMMMLCMIMMMHLLLTNGIDYDIQDQTAAYVEHLNNFYLSNGNLGLALRTQPLRLESPKLSWEKYCQLKSKVQAMSAKQW